MKIVYDDKEGLCTSRTDPNDTSVITMMNLDDWFLPRDAIDIVGLEYNYGNSTFYRK